MTPQSIYKTGDTVQRRNRADGSPPPYRFRSRVCGSYYNFITDTVGAAVCSEAEPGCVQIFPDYMLELVSAESESV